MTGKSLRYFRCLDTMRTIHCGYDRLLEALELNPNPVKTVINTISGQQSERENRAFDGENLHTGDLKAYRLEGVKFVHGQHL